MTTADFLMLDAKQGIFQEHHRRLQHFHEEGRWAEVLQEIAVIQGCATDLLNEALQILDEALEIDNPPPADHAPYPPPPHRGSERSE